MEGTTEAKRAAAVAAVYAYLAQRAVSVGGAGAQSVSAGFQPSLWALFGRQALMNQRIRMQSRRRA